MEDESEIYENSGDNLPEEDQRLEELANAIREKYSYFMAIAYRFVNSKSDAEDIVQTTFLKAWRSLRSYNAGTNIIAWLARILTNNAINHIRKNNRAHLISLTDEDTGEDIEIGDRQEDESFELSYDEEATTAHTEGGYISFIRDRLSDEIVEVLDEMDERFRTALLLLMFLVVVIKTLQILQMQLLEQL